jgi:hypothetical protein
MTDHSSVIIIHDAGKVLKREGTATRRARQLNKLHPSLAECIAPRPWRLALCALPQARTSRMWPNQWRLGIAHSPQSTAYPLRRLPGSETATWHAAVALYLDMSAYMSTRRVKPPAAPLSSFLSSFLPFSSSTAPQAFPRPVRRMLPPGARRVCQGSPLFGGHRQARPLHDGARRRA